jgi:hypothetical protein
MLKHAGPCRNHHRRHLPVIALDLIPDHRIEVNPKSLAHGIEVIELRVRHIVLHQDQHPTRLHPRLNRISASLIHIVRRWISHRNIRRCDYINLRPAQIRHRRRGRFGRQVHSIALKRPPKERKPAIRIIIPLVMEQLRLPRGILPRLRVEPRIQQHSLSRAGPVRHGQLVLRIIHPCLLADVVFITPRTVRLPAQPANLHRPIQHHQSIRT